jgi:hypothetical protein
MTVFIIITACLLNDPKNNRSYATRKIEYTSGISALLERCKDKPYKLIIVENNSLLDKVPFLLKQHKTFLEDFGIPVVYTRNNIYKIKNYGTKELLDIKHVIDKLNIQDDDFIVKMTGRYVLDKISPFFDVIEKLHESPYSAVVRFGAYTNFEKIREKDNCTTGLIGMKCKYVRQLDLPDEDTFVEKVWAKKIALLPESEVCIIEKLGIFIRPATLECYILI